MSGIVGGAGSKSGIIGSEINPSQPAFNVIPASDQNNLSNDSNISIQFGTVRFDQGNNFGSHTFVAPVTGKYQLNAYIAFHSMQTNASYYQIALATSNRTYYSYVDPGSFDSNTEHWTIGISVLADMDANDSVYLHTRTSDGTAAADIKQASTFSGFLAC